MVVTIEYENKILKWLNAAGNLSDLKFNFT